MPLSVELVIPEGDTGSLLYLLALDRLVRDWCAGSLVDGWVDELMDGWNMDGLVTLFRYHVMRVVFLTPSGSLLISSSGSISRSATGLLTSMP